MSVLEAIVIAIVEGLTEFLPISSTGHMIIAERVLGVVPDSFTKAYIVSIQFGAILSVVALYWKRFLVGLDLYWKLGIAFVPAAVMGFLLDRVIDSLLDNVLVVALALLLGGVVLLFIDRWLDPKEERPVTYLRALWIGCWQCIALIPGVSRSAATIIGGMANGLTRKQAAEFSFFLAVPTMFAATTFKVIKGYSETPEIFTREKFGLLLLGNGVAFVVAVLAIRFFIGYLQKHGFQLFGWYRIALGLAILVLLGLGHDLKML